MMVIFIAGIIVGWLIGGWRKKQCYCVNKWRER